MDSPPPSGFTSGSRELQPHLRLVLTTGRPVRSVTRSKTICIAAAPAVRSSRSLAVVTDHSTLKHRRVRLVGRRGGHGQVDHYVDQPAAGDVEIDSYLFGMLGSPTRRLLMRRRPGAGSAGHVAAKNITTEKGDRGAAALGPRPFRTTCGSTVCSTAAWYWKPRTESRPVGPRLGRRSTVLPATRDKT